MRLHLVSGFASVFVYQDAAAKRASVLRIFDGGIALKNTKRRTDANYYLALIAHHIAPAPARASDPALPAIA